MTDRSFLFVPANRPERFDRACGVGADVVLIDLEDAVAPEDKLAARNAVATWLSPGKAVYLRINGPDSPWFDDDLSLLSMPGVRGIALPKAEDHKWIAIVAEASSHGLPLIPLIESARGLHNIEKIASSRGVARLAFGSADFQLDLSINGDGEELLFARSQLVLSSRIAGLLPPIDGVTFELDDQAALVQDVARARRQGFGGKLCVHPRQVETINAGFRPSVSEIEWAQRVISAAESAGDHAVRLDGKLVDRPIVERAKRILDDSRQA